MKVVFFGANARLFREGMEAGLLPAARDHPDRRRRTGAMPPAAPSLRPRRSSASTGRTRASMSPGSGSTMWRPPASTACGWTCSRRRRCRLQLSWPRAGDRRVCDAGRPSARASGRGRRPLPAARRVALVRAERGELREELGGRTIGILGFGHIGQAVAARAKAFDLRVIAANRSPMQPGPLVDLALPLEEVGRLYRESHVVVCTLPLVDETLLLRRRRGVRPDASRRDAHQCRTRPGRR